MSDAVKEEELGDVESLYQHSEACCDNSCQGDYVEYTDDLKDDVAWACQGLLEERHCLVMLGVETCWLGLDLIEKAM